MPPLKRCPSAVSILCTDDSWLSFYCTLLLRPVCALLIVVLIATTAGCQLFSVFGMGFADETVAQNGKAERSNKPPLPGLPNAQDATQIEIVFAQRPIGDTEMGDALWNEIDQVCNFDEDLRKNLSAHDIRAGHIGSTMPPVLEKLLGMTDSERQSQSESSQSLSGRRVLLRPGAETEIQTSLLVPERTVRFIENGETHEESFRNARCVVRVTSHRLQDGWVKLELVPEIHHGPQTLRRIATEGGWRLKTQQEIQPLYQLKISFDLNVGEMVAMTTNAAEENSLGRNFFTGVERHSHIQRLLVVRVANMGRLEAVYQEQPR